MGATWGAYVGRHGLESIGDTFARPAAGNAPTGCAAGVGGLASLVLIKILDRKVSHADNFSPIQMKFK